MPERGPVWQGDMDPTLSQLLQHLFNSDSDRTRLTRENEMLRIRIADLEAERAQGKQDPV